MESVSEVLLVSDSANKDCNCLMYDLNTGNLLETYKEGHSIRHGLQFIGRDYVISAFKDKPSIKIWQIGSASSSCRKMTCPNFVSALAVSKCGRYCIAGIEKGIFIWEVATGNLDNHLEYHTQDITCIRFTSDGSHFITAGKDGMVLVFVFYETIISRENHDVPKPCYQWIDHTAEVTDVYVGYMGFYSRVATASKDMSCRMYELDTGKHLFTVHIDAPISAITMDVCENFLFLGTTVGDIYRINLFSNVHPVMDYGSEEKKSIFVGHKKEITSLCVSQSGKYLISGSNDKEFRLWTIANLVCYKVQTTAGPVTNVLSAPLPPGCKNKNYDPRIIVNDFKRVCESECHDVDVNINDEELSLFHSGAPDRLFDNKVLHWSNDDMEKCLAKGNLSVEDLSRINNQMYSFALVDIFEKTTTAERFKKS